LLQSGKPSTSTVSNTSSAHSRKKPVGAIVGGVVGGLSAIAVAIAILFVLRKPKRTTTLESFKKEESVGPVGPVEPEEPSIIHHELPALEDSKEYHNKLVEHGKLAELQAPVPTELPTNETKPPTNPEKTSAKGGGGINVTIDEVNQSTTEAEHKENTTATTK
jgi:hypothetical protein